MSLTIAELLDAVEKYAGNTDAHSQAAFARDFALLKGRLEGVASSTGAVEAVASPWIGDPVVTRALTFDEALAKWNAAETEALKAAGKPYAEEGGPRGSFPRDSQIELAKSIGVYDQLIAEDPNFFGPEPGP